MHKSNHQLINIILILGTIGIIIVTAFYWWFTTPASFDTSSDHGTVHNYLTIILFLSITGLIGYILNFLRHLNETQNNKLSINKKKSNK